MAVLMENNTSVKEANKEVIMAKTVITVNYLAARSNLKTLVRSILQWKVRQICSKILMGAMISTVAHACLFV